MARQSGGDKRSSWVTFTRRLFLVRRLIRSPAPAATLIAAARTALGEEIYPPEANAALRHDLAALRNEFGATVQRQADGHYHLTDPGILTLLDLPDEELEAVAFLRAAVANGTLPNTAQLDALLRRLLTLMPAERRRQLQVVLARPRLIEPHGMKEPAAAVIATLKRVIGQQPVRFAYYSPYGLPGQSEAHQVAPYDLFYREGQIYLEAYCRECSDPRLIHRYILYRLDRIIPDTLQVLPERLPPGQPTRPLYTLRYWLGPRVAGQRDIVLWFPGSQVAWQADGSALVKGEASDLWNARQVLLRYREHCRVLAPPELVQLMREATERMAQLYDE